jgi:hypothetical protein
MNSAYCETASEGRRLLEQKKQLAPALDEGQFGIPLSGCGGHV